MQQLSNISGSDSESSKSIEIDDFEQASSRKQDFKNIIDEANSVQLKKLFEYYSIKIDEFNRKIICPFKSHKGKNYGGKENSPSFWFYPDTNSFWCFGCKTGTRPVDFVSAYDNLDNISSALRIIDLFESDNFISNNVNGSNYSSNLDILLDFSNYIRLFMQENQGDCKAIIYAENLSSVLDELNYRHKLNSKALQSIIDKLKERVSLYK